MRVLCIANKGEALPKHYLDPRIPRGPKSEFFVTVGNSYLVYAIRCLSNQIWYYIDDDQHHWYPIRKPAPLFKVVDPRLSAHWKIRVSDDGNGGDVLIAFEEWFSDPRFYDRLTDRLDKDVKLFQQRKSQMDEEFGLAEPTVP